MFLPTCIYEKGKENKHGFFVFDKIQLSFASTTREIVSFVEHLNKKHNVRPHETLINYRFGSILSLTILPFPNI
jgi:hypothetical protein